MTRRVYQYSPIVRGGLRFGHGGSEGHELSLGLGEVIASEFEVHLFFDFR